MSNAADDIFEVTGLPYFEYVDKGLLVEIYGIMEKDERYRADDFYQNVLKAMEYKDGLYAYPKGFDIEFMAINKKARVTVTFLPAPFIPNMLKNRYIAVF